MLLGEPELRKVGSRAVAEGVQAEVAVVQQLVANPPLSGGTTKQLPAGG